MVAVTRALETEIEIEVERSLVHVTVESGKIHVLETTPVDAAVDARRKETILELDAGAALAEEVEKWT